MLHRDCHPYQPLFSTVEVIRKEHFVKIKGTVITAIGFDCWKINFNKKDIICQLVIDCQKLVDTGLLPKIDDMVSVSSLHIGQVGSTSDWLNLLFSVCSMYVPVSILAFVMACLTSRTGNEWTLQKN
jgi:hypothetical protein